MRCLQLSCDQGEDVHGTLMLPDGTVIEFEMREDKNNRGLISISRWEPVGWDERETAVGRAIIAAAGSSAFDRRVRDYFEQHWLHRDFPLSPKA